MGNICIGKYMIKDIYSWNKKMLQIKVKYKGIKGFYV